jgi:hypothetical protein
VEPILDKARAGQNALERLASAVPGFKGYRERELRRDADRQQREHLADRLEVNKKTLNQIADQATRGGGSLDAINDVETARKRLDRVAARLRYAERGYSGFFDAVKVDEAVLARVYEFDLSLLDGVEAVRAATEAARAAGPDGVRPALQAVAEAVARLDERLTERDAILRGVS